MEQPVHFNRLCKLDVYLNVVQMDHVIRSSRGYDAGGCGDTFHRTLHRHPSLVMPDQDRTGLRTLWCDISESEELLGVRIRVRNSGT